jgi:hypothetical protein
VSTVQSVPAISLVIPVFNEEESLAALMKALDAALPGLPQPAEAVLVDDGSRDRSPALLREAAATRPWLRVVRFRRNFGQTAAIAAGIDHARGPIIVALDADLQNDPADIPRLLARLDEGFDVVSGWRRDRKDKAVTRRLPSMVANWLIGYVTGVRIHDYGCTLKAYRRWVLEPYGLYGEMHRFIPIYASWAGARVTEMEVTHHPRVAGQSQVRPQPRVQGAARPAHGHLPRRLLHQAHLLLRPPRARAVHRRRALRRPVRRAVCPQPPAGHRGSVDSGHHPALLAVFLFSLGVQFLLMGLLGEISFAPTTSRRARRPTSSARRVNFDPASPALRGNAADPAPRTPRPHVRHHRHRAPRRSAPRPRARCAR